MTQDVVAGPKVPDKFQKKCQIKSRPSDRLSALNSDISLQNNIRSDRTEVFKVLLTQSLDAGGQAGNSAGGGIFVQNTFGNGAHNFRFGRTESFRSGSLIVL